MKFKKPTLKRPHVFMIWKTIRPLRSAPLYGHTSCTIGIWTNLSSGPIRSKPQFITNGFRPTGFLLPKLAHFSFLRPNLRVLGNPNLNILLLFFFSFFFFMLEIRNWSLELHFVGYRIVNCFLIIDCCRKIRCRKRNGL